MRLTGTAWGTGRGGHSHTTEALNPCPWRLGSTRCNGEPRKEWKLEWAVLPAAVRGRNQRAAPKQEAWQGLVRRSREWEVGGTESSQGSLQNGHLGLGGWGREEGHKG